MMITRLTIAAFFCFAASAAFGQSTATFPAGSGSSSASTFTSALVILRGGGL